MIKTYTVALLYSSGLEARQFVHHFRIKMKETMPNALMHQYCYKFNKVEHLQVCAKDIIAKEFDAVVVYGVFSANNLAYELQKAGKKIPVIYTSVLNKKTVTIVQENSSVSYGVACSEQKGGEIMSIIHKCKPTLRSVVFLYDRDSDEIKKRGSNEIFTRYKNDAISYCNEHFIECSFYNNANNPQLESLLVALKDCDTVITVEGYFDSFRAASLSEFCIANNKTLVSGNSDLVQHGKAALSYGFDRGLLASEAANSVEQILTGKELPFQHVHEIVTKERILSVNIALSSGQGLDTDYILSKIALLHKSILF